MGYHKNSISAVCLSTPGNTRFPSRRSLGAQAVSLLVAVCILFSSLLLSSCAQDPLDPQQELTLVLASERQSDYRVILSADADEELCRIAEEFVSYFSALTGATLPVLRDDEPESAKEIRIGKTNRAGDDFDYEINKEDTFCYQTCGESLLLTGAGNRGVAYAVYAFFEDVCGVRYYTPDYEYVPELTVLSLKAPLAVVSAPVFTIRDLDGAGSTDPKWMVKMRLNGLQSLGSERFRKTPFIGGGYGYAGWFVHTVAQLAEMEAGPNGYWDIQPCLTDETVYQTVLKNVRNWLEENPEARLVSISQNDGDKNSMCQCERCRAFVAEHGDAESALWIYFVSRIAQELKAEYPDVQFETLAYTFTAKAPTGLSIPENTAVRFAPLHACMRHGIFTCTQDDSVTAELRENLVAWSELLGGNVNIWDYDAFFSEYWSPNVNFSHLRENLDSYADLGVSGVFVQGDGSASNGFSELRAYLDAKLIWNPKMEDEEFFSLMRDFCEGYYGTGTSGPLMRYMDLIDEKTRDTHYTVYAHATIDYLPCDVIEYDNGEKRLDMSFINSLQSCFNKAETEVSDPEQLLRLKKARLQLQYYELICYHYMVDTCGNQSYVSARNQLGSRLYTDARELGISQLMEGYPLSKTTTETWRHPLKWYQETW